VSGSRCLFCGADIPSGETIRMVTRYSCRKCWSQDIDKLLADCRAALSQVLGGTYSDSQIVALLARLPARPGGDHKEDSNG